MRGLQIWPPNSNRITFAPILATKLIGKLARWKMWNVQIVENWPNWIFYQFWQFLTKMGVKYQSVCILRPHLEFYNNLSSLSTPFVILFTFWIFGPTMLTERQSRCDRYRYWFNFAKSGTDGHQMDQIMGKTKCSAKNQDFVIFEIA